MIITLILLFLIFVALGFGLLAAFNDIKNFTIPNYISIGVVICAILSLLIANFFVADSIIFSDWKSHIISGISVFVITYALFYFGHIGGGDAKLLSAYALMVGGQGLMPLMFFMAIAGGLMGGFTLLLNKKTLFPSPKSGGWIDVAQKQGKKVPYAGAIFVGAVAAFWHNGYLSIDTYISILSTVTNGAVS